MKNIEVEVTEKHIKNGQPYTSRSCPVALALKDVLAKDAGYEIVVGDYITIYTQDGSFVRKTNPKVRNFIQRFDKGQSVKPFSFTIKSK